MRDDTRATDDDLEDDFEDGADDEFDDDDEFGADEEQDQDWHSSREPLRARWDPAEVDDTQHRGPRPDRGAKRQSVVGRFVSAYGWRAYALPILLIITVLVLTDAVRAIGASAPASNGAAAVAPSASPPASTAASPPGTGNYAAAIPTGVLPEGGPFAVEGKNSWRRIPGTTQQVGQGTQQTFNYTIDVEDGIDTTSLGGDQAIATMIDQTLGNPKSWTKDQKYAFRRVDPNSKSPDFRISLTSQMSARKACGFDIPIDASCYNQGLGRVVLNVARWTRGALPFEGDVGSYRQYQINHEVGHAIGFKQHAPCDVDGGLAPVMMQQTFGTANNDIAKLDPAGVVPMDGKKCHFNAWPYPRG